MNRIVTLTLLFFTSILAFGQAPITNYSFKFKITGLPDSIDSAAFMANYYGSKQYYFDTVAFENSTLHFTGDTIKGGIYSIILGDKKSYFEFVVNEPKIEMETKFEEFVQAMKVKTSEENSNFYEYLKFIEGKSKAVEGMRERMEAAETDEAKEPIQKEMAQIDKEVSTYKKKFIEEHPDLFISKVFRASAEPEVSDFAEIEDKDERQKMRYRVFKKEYLKHMDFADARLLRTPVLHNKLNYYISKLVPQTADSIIKEADAIIERARPSREVYKYIVHTITVKYEDPKIMGLDAVLVHMGQNYYCPDKAWWLSKKKLEEFCDRINHMAPLLIGNPAPDLTLVDTNGTWQTLSKQGNKFTVLYFWDSGCGHCKKVTPKLKTFYEEYRDKGVGVYAVGTELENKDWKKYIKKNNLSGPNWMNVSDTPEINKNAEEILREGKTTLQSLNFRDTYDIFSTPKLYLLDDQNTIIASKLMPEQLGDFIDHVLDEQSSEDELNQVIDQDLEKKSMQKVREGSK